MNLLMISGDRSIAQGKKGAFWYTLEELSKHWDRIDIITPGSKQSAVSSKQVMHDNVYLHPSPHALWYQPWWIQKKGSTLIKECRHNVMTVQDYPPFYNGIAAKWLKKKFGIPYALEIHHLVGHPHPASLSEKVGSKMSKLYLAKDALPAAKVRTVNSEVGDILKKWGVPEEKVTLVPSFYLDQERLVQVPDQKKKYDIAFCARLVANKGIKELLEAVSLLQQCTLVIIGDGAERENMESYAKELGIADRVNFTGWLPDQETVLATMKSASMFVMNSKSEGGPRVLLEAMAIGLPVISTPVGIAPDVIEVGKNGLLTTGSAQNLGFRIQTLLRDADMRERLGSEAHKILGRFKRSESIARYADFIKSCA